MLNKLKIIITLIILFSSVYSVERLDGSLILNDRIFDAELEKYNFLVVEFYSSTCEHCKKFDPEYIKLTQKLIQMNPPIFTSKVNSDENRKLCEKYGIKTVPSVLIFEKGKQPINYSGNLKFEELFTFLEYLAYNKNENITEKQITDFFNNHKSGFIFLGKHKDNYETYNSIAKTMIDRNFVTCPTDECLKRFDAKNWGIIYFNYNGEDVVKYNEKTHIDISKFIQIYAFDLIVRPSTRLQSFILSTRFVFLVLFTTDVFKAKVKKNHMKILNKVLAPYKGKIQGVLDYGRTKEEVELIKFFNMKVTDVPIIGLLDNSEGQMKKFKMAKDDIEVDSINNFLTKWQSKKIQPYRTTEDLPDEQPEDYKIVVEANYKEIVLDNKNDILVILFNPNDELSTKLIKEFHEVIGKLKSQKGVNENIVFVKINGTKNEIEHLEDKNILRIPALFLIPGNNKNKLIFYSGNINSEDICDFIENNSFHPIERDDL